MTREEAIEKLTFLRDNACNYYFSDEDEDALTMAIEALKHPEPKKGKWIDAREYCSEFMCSNCHRLNRNNTYNFCPDCGARMED